MISLVLVKTIFTGKIGYTFLWSVPFTVFAVTEAFMGQMLIALVVALIGAAPPTVAIILASKKQSEERRLGQAAILKNQEEMNKSLDGKLSELVQAKTDVARHEGVQQERSEERERVADTSAPAAVAAVIHQAAQAAADAVKADPDLVAKMEIVNQDENAVPMREVNPPPK